MRDQFDSTPDGSGEDGQDASMPRCADRGSRSRSVGSCWAVQELPTTRWNSIAVPIVYGGDEPPGGPRRRPS